MYISFRRRDIATYNKLTRREKKMPFAFSFINVTLSSRIDI